MQNGQKQNSLTCLDFLSLDKSVLSERGKNLRDGRSRFRVNRGSARGIGDGGTPGPNDLLPVQN
jgi:hypothetical protein